MTSGYQGTKGIRKGAHGSDVPANYNAKDRATIAKGKAGLSRRS